MSYIYLSKDLYKAFKIFQFCNDTIHCQTRKKQGYIYFHILAFLLAVYLLNILIKVLRVTLFALCNSSRLKKLITDKKDFTFVLLYIIFLPFYYINTICNINFNQHGKDKINPVPITKNIISFLVVIIFALRF